VLALAIVNPVARGPSRRVQAAWLQRLKRARSLYAEKVAIRKELLAEHRGRVWPINLEPDPDGRFVWHLALQEESAARTEYMRILRNFNKLMRECTLPEEAPGLFLVDRETASYLHWLSTMSEEDQETPLQEMDPQQLAEETVWLRLFVRQASKRGYTIEDIAAMLDEPGMTANEAVGRILSATRPKPN
jgi:hypothetical protein